MEQPLSAEELVPFVREALEMGDLEAYAELLDPNVRWGAPGDPAPPCQNRKQVLEWYSRGRADGRRASVTEIAAGGDKILVSMRVSSPGPDGSLLEGPRWQVLAVSQGRIVDIRGYETEEQAASAAGFAP